MHVVVVNKSNVHCIIKLEDGRPLGLSKMAADDGQLIVVMEVDAG